MNRSVLVLGFLTLLSGSALAEEFKGPQEGAPNVYKQLFENDKVRISEITFEPGVKAAMHTHPYAHAVYIIDGGTLTLNSPEGKATELTAKSGDVLWIEPETHEAVNTGDTALRATVTEIK